MATVLYAVIDPSLEQMRVSLAGHLPPVIAAPGSQRNWPGSGRA